MKKKIESFIKNGNDVLLNDKDLPIAPKGSLWKFYKNEGLFMYVQTNSDEQDPIWRFLSFTHLGHKSK